MGQSKVLDVARQFFSNSNITINLIPALIAGGLLLLLLPLLFLFLAPADDAGSGYGAPAAEYGAPSSSYGAPSSSYGYRADEGYEEGSYRSLWCQQRPPRSRSWRGGWRSWPCPSS